MASPFATQPAEVMPHAISGQMSDASSELNRVDSGGSAGGMPSTKSASLRQWSSAVRKVSVALDVVNRFKALRDTAGSAYIDPSRLKTVRASLSMLHYVSNTGRAHYTVKPLGAGAFAKVEMCTLDGKDQVAVKTLKAELFHNQTDLEDFVKEGVLLSTLSHPSIVKVIGLGFDQLEDGHEVSPESMFMVAELCHGGSLRDVVRDQMVSFSKVVYTYADALRWAISIAEGLAYLHQQRPMIIHRDVKLDNVLLQGTEKRWDAKLTDFGLHATVEAKDTSSVSRSVKSRAEATAEVPEGSALSAPAPRSGKRAALMRKVKTMGGSARHNVYDLTGQTGSFLNMAPEVVLGKPYDQKCDVFSLGTILYEIFAKSIAAHDIAYTGAPEEFQIYATRVARGYRRPHPKHWGAELSSLITDCMHQEAIARPKASEVAMRLRELGESGAIASMDAKASGGCCVVQ